MLLGADISQGSQHSRGLLSLLNFGWDIEVTGFCLEPGEILMFWEVGCFLGAKRQGGSFDVCEIRCEDDTSAAAHIL